MFDEHESGQLRLGATGDQLELLPLRDELVPLEAPASPAETELARRHPCQWCGGEAIAGTTCPRSIACPACHQPPGSPCRRPSDHRAADMHAARWEKAEELDELAGIHYEGSSTL